MKTARKRAIVKEKIYLENYFSLHNCNRRRSIDGHKLDIRKENSAAETGFIIYCSWNRDIKRADLWRFDWKSEAFY